LRFGFEPTLYPTELGSIQRRHLHHGDLHIALVVQQLGAQGNSKAEQPMLRYRSGNTSPQIFRLAEAVLLSNFPQLDS